MGEKRLICFRRRKLSSYLCVLLFLAVVYFIFQGTSLRVLHKSNEKAERIVQSKTGTIQKHRPKSNPTILGVRTDDLLYYKADEDGLFHCIDGSEKIPMTRVNDEYCDCPSDGSDEPGTDACPNARFFCELENKFLPSGKVNDGLCDCCDGSDEWKVTLGSEKVKGFPISDLIQHAPCVDTCSRIEEQQKEQQRIRQIGLRIKQQYIERAKSHLPNDNYGDQGEFYELSRECYDYADHSAVYKICPWDKVEQTQKGHVFRVGRKGHWDTRHKDKQILIMDDGERRGCPNGPRRAEIEFKCGLSNTVSKLQEENKCVYAIEFLTPAAC